MKVTVEYPGEGRVTYASEGEREIFETLRRETGLSVRLINILIGAVMLAEIDPIVPETLEVFVFNRRRVQTHTFGDHPDDYDFYWFNTEIPNPYANVNLFVALNEFTSDTDRMHVLLDPERIISGQTTTDKLDQISKCLLAWFKFMAVRHPNARRRRIFAECARDVGAGIKEWRQQMSDTGKVLPFKGAGDKQME